MRQGGKVSKTVIVILCFVFVAIAAAIIVFCGQSTSKRFQKQFEMGAKYLAELEYDQAIVLFEKAIDIKPDSVDAYLCLADAYLGKGQQDKAIEILQTGYNKTGDLRLQEKLDDLKNAISDQPSVEIIAPIINEETGLDGTEAEFVNGIMHHAYFEYELSDSSKMYLSHVIDLLQSEEYHEAIEYSLSQQMVPLLREIAIQDEDNEVEELLYSDREGMLNPDSTEYDYICRILYNDYKIYIRYDYNYMNAGNADPWERCEMYLIPHSEGMGYFFIGVRNYSYDDIINEYGSCYCYDGMYNGDALLYQEDNWDYGYGANSDGGMHLKRQGKMENGLCEGRWTTIVDFHGGYTELVIADYNGGHRIAMGQFTDLNTDVNTATLYEYTEDNFVGMPDSVYYDAVPIEEGVEVYPY